MSYFYANNFDIFGVVQQAQPFLAIANFFFFFFRFSAGKSYFSRKYAVPQFATDEKRRNVVRHSP